MGYLSLTMNVFEVKTCCGFSFPHWITIYRKYLKLCNFLVIAIKKNRFSFLASKSKIGSGYLPNCTWN